MLPIFDEFGKLKFEVKNSVVDGHQTVHYQPGALFCGVNCLVVFPTHFNLNNSLLKLLQISLLFS